jgi:hypothetical protein
MKLVYPCVYRCISSRVAAPSPYTSYWLRLGLAQAEPTRDPECCHVLGATHGRGANEPHGSPSDPAAAPAGRSRRRSQEPGTSAGPRAPRDVIGPGHRIPLRFDLRGHGRAVHLFFTDGAVTSRPSIQTYLYTVRYSLPALWTAYRRRSGEGHSAQGHSHGGHGRDVRTKKSPRALIYRSASSGHAQSCSASCVYDA